MPLVLWLLVITLLLVYLVRRTLFAWSFRSIPGPPSLPLLGNALQLAGSQADFFRLLVRLGNQYKDGVFRLWVGNRPFVFLYKAEIIQPLLNSNLHIDKSIEYSFLDPWVGTGLITSTGMKWHHRRKLLTPAFHYGILEEFPVHICKESLVLVEQLRKELGRPSFDVVPYLKLCTLDIICDTAMGKEIHAQTNSHKEYVNAIEKITHILAVRFITPWLKPNWIFKMTSYGKEMVKCVDLIHSFTNTVIRERRDEMGSLQNGQLHQSSKGVLKKKRLALLDLLFDLSDSNGLKLSEKDIQEEVNTIMFAGHDTTALAVSWTLYALGHHPDIQQKIVDEIDSISSQILEKGLSMKQTNQLEYLERCIKEALRIFPITPNLGRNIICSLKTDSVTLVPGTTAIIQSYLLHRDPRFFPDPEKFDPDRFLPECVSTRHPFAYIPFSAGPRNCIGQRFAMIEMKIILAMVLKHYIVQSVENFDQLNMVPQVVLENVGGIKLSITERTQT